MSVPRFNEKTAAWVQFWIYDKDHVAATPSALKYRIDCLTSGTEIKDDTVLTPASSGEIDLVPADTTLTTQDNATELRLITVTADADTNGQLISHYQYEVYNEYAVPDPTP